MTTDREALGALIAQRLHSALEEATAHYSQSKEAIGNFVVDDLLPAEVAHRIRTSFPEAGDMRLLKTMRERKLVSAQMDRHDPILEEIVFAFQQPAVVDLVRKITGITSAFPDEHLYAGGISMMEQGHFLNPHLDNSHDRDRDRWRVLNLLYYVSPDWDAAKGGNLELWPGGVGRQGTAIVSRFNRLAVMATHSGSWHSVSPVRASEARCCVSNYYFSNEPLRDTDDFHVTSYRGRPEQPVRDAVLRLDAFARGMLRKAFPKGVRPNPHVYRREA